MENRLPDWLEQTVETIAETFHPERIVLFGSHARGEANLESDIDLFIEMETSLSLPERAIAISDLFGLRPWSLDLVVYTPDEVRKLHGIHGTSYHKSSGTVMCSMKKAESNYKAWLSKAANDMLNIENNLSAESVPWDTVCFRAQQAAEKTLKAFLSYHAKPITRTHDLVALLAQVVEIHPPLKRLRTACQRLNYYAITSRYPDDLFEPEEEEGKEMITISQEIQTFVIELIPE
jgi:HEPN domain-containing protein/predicted nucleotidyltransferase